MDNLKGLTLASVVSVVLMFGLVSVGSATHIDPNCFDEFPDIDISPTHIVGAPGDLVVFTVFVENDDNDNCPTKNFDLTSDDPPGVTVSFSPSTLIISPKNDDTALMKVSIPSGASNGTIPINVFVSEGNLTSNEFVQVDVREDIEECTVKVSNLRFREVNDVDFDNEFSDDDQVSVFADIALVSNAPSEVTMELYVEGLLFDSETDLFGANSDATFKFGNRIFTEAFNDRIDVEVVAIPACDPTEDDSADKVLRINVKEEDIELEIDVGTPSNTFIGEEVKGRVFIENIGEENVRVNVDAFICEGNDCTQMDCGESIFFIIEDELEELVCTATATKAGDYKVKTITTYEDDKDTYTSRQFTIFDSAAEQSQTSVTVSSGSGEASGKIRGLDYVCDGNIRQALYTTLTATRTSDIEFCPLGCEDGQCVDSPPARDFVVGSESEDETVEEETEKPRFNEPELDLNNFFDWLKNLFI